VWVGGTVVYVNNVSGDPKIKSAISPLINVQNLIFTRITFNVKNIQPI
jgi:hypothetical protein